MSASSIVLNELVCATKSTLVSCVAELLEVQAGEIDPRAEFNTLGFDSIGLLRLTDVLYKQLGIELSPTI
jgi:acyl carrier protein